MICYAPLKELENVCVHASVQCVDLPTVFNHVAFRAHAIVLTRSVNEARMGNSERRCGNALRWLQPLRLLSLSFANYKVTGEDLRPALRCFCTFVRMLGVCYIMIVCTSELVSRVS